MKVHISTLEDFQQTTRLVWRVAGFKLVVLVMKMSSVCNHSVVALRWCDDGSLLCQNSYGDAEALLSVDQHTFVKAYFVDVSISRVWCPGQRKTDECDLPAVSPLWNELHL